MAYELTEETENSRHIISDVYFQGLFVCFLFIYYFKKKNDFQRPNSIEKTKLKKKTEVSCGSLIFVSDD